jgi:hypothetical protein
MLSSGHNITRANQIIDKCGMNFTERASHITSALGRNASDLADLVASSTVQYKARQWIIKVDDGLLCGEDARLIQRYTLAVIYYALNGREWTNCQSILDNGTAAGPCDTGNSARWLSGASECTWYGVTCDKDGRVSVLRLKGNNLAGELPRELFTSLPWLSGLSLDNNKNIAGAVPSIMSFVNLTYIELDGNALTGTFPDAFYSMTTLKAIDIKGNHFSGSISNEIGNLVDLMVLQLQNNKFDGKVPSDGLAQLPDMRKWTDDCFAKELARLLTSHFDALTTHSLVNASWKQLYRFGGCRLHQPCDHSTDKSWLPSVLFY